VEPKRPFESMPFPASKVSRDWEIPKFRFGKVGLKWGFFFRDQARKSTIQLLTRVDPRLLDALPCLNGQE
jgi:hypothetical protein